MTLKTEKYFINIYRGIVRVTKSCDTSIPENEFFLIEVSQDTSDFNITIHSTMSGREGRRKRMLFSSTGQQ